MMTMLFQSMSWKLIKWLMILRVWRKRARCWLIRDNSSLLFRGSPSKAWIIWASLANLCRTLGQSVSTSIFDQNCKATNRRWQRKIKKYLKWQNNLPKRTDKIMNFIKSVFNLTWPISRNRTERIKLKQLLLWKNWRSRKLIFWSKYKKIKKLLGLWMSKWANWRNNWRMCLNSTKTLHHC